MVHVFKLRRSTKDDFLRKQNHFEKRVKLGRATEQLLALLRSNKSDARGQIVDVPLTWKRLKTDVGTPLVDLKKRSVFDKHRSVMRLWWCTLGYPPSLERGDILDLEWTLNTYCSCRVLAIPTIIASLRSSFNLALPPPLFGPFLDALIEEHKKRTRGLRLPKFVRSLECKRMIVAGSGSRLSTTWARASWSNLDPCIGRRSSEESERSSLTAC